jgi:hypothetical protein
MCADHDVDLAGFNLRYGFRSVAVRKRLSASIFRGTPGVAKVLKCWKASTVWRQTATWRLSLTP